MSRAYHATPSRSILQTRSSNISETGLHTPLLDDIEGSNDLDDTERRKSQGQISCCQRIMSIFSFQWTPHHRDLAARRRRRALFLSYLPDWILSIVLAAAFFSLDKVPGYKRHFSIDDPTLRFPFATHERVPPFALYMLAVVSPFVLQIIANLLTIRSLWDFHSSTLGLLLSLVLTGSITQFTKITVGRPRPDVISRCQPSSGITNPEYGLVTVAICHQTDTHILNDGWRSFPSGHSSLSFAGLGFLAFYLAGKVHLFDEKGHTIKAWISLVPLSAAALVAISRTMDSRHHWQDVLIGSALGLTTAYFSYRQYYPPLHSPVSDLPYAPRILGQNSSDPHVLNGLDEEGRIGGGLGVDTDPDTDRESRAPILQATMQAQDARQRSTRRTDDAAIGQPATYPHYRDEDDLRSGTSVPRMHHRGESEEGEMEMEGRRLSNPNVKN